MNNIGKKSRVGIYWNITLKVIQQLYHFAVVIIVARILGPKDFGAMAIAMAIIVYANSLTSFGLTGALVQKEKIEKGFVDSVFTFNLAFSIFLIPLCLYLAHSLSSFFNSPEIEAIIPPLTVIFPLTSFYYIPMALLRRDLNFKTHSLIDLLQNIVQSTSMLVLAISGFGIWSLVYGQILGIAVSVLAVLLVTKWRPRLSLDLRSLRGAADYGFWDVIRNHVNYIEDYASYFIISRFLNPTMVGFFDRASSIAGMPLKRIQVQVNAVFFSSFSRLQGEPERLAMAFHKSLASTALIALPLLSGLALVSPYLVIVFLGPVWVLTVLPMQILCMAGMLKMIYNVFRNVNIATNSYRSQTIANVISVAVYVALCFLGIKWGIVGVSYATLASSLVAFYVYGHLTSLSIKVSWFAIIRSLIPAVSASAFMALILIFLSIAFLSDYTVINLSLLVAIGCVVYLAWIVFIPFKETRPILDDVVGDVKPLMKLIGTIRNN